LVAVIAGIVLNQFFSTAVPSLAVVQEHLVSIPVPEGFRGLLELFTFPDFGQLLNPVVWTTAFTMAVVASLETLLCVEATDKLDPFRRVTPASRELKAQGIGNMLSGLVGGLPVTQVIVRSSANIQSGGRTKASAILHGAWLLVAALAIPSVLNLIPLATLAAILLVVGYKLAKPSIFKQMYLLGKYQYIPFFATVVGILLTDLLVGIGIGMSIAIFFILLNNLRNPYFLMEETHDDNGDTLTLRLSEDVSFLNRAIIMKTLDTIPPHTKVLIDASKSVNIDYDVYEIIREFEERALQQDIELKVRGLALRQRNDGPEQVLKVMAERKEKKNEPTSVG
jgi:MFS superfamily sulfate permease-like transporter